MRKNDSESFESTLSVDSAKNGIQIPEIRNSHCLFRGEISEIWSARA